MGEMMSLTQWWQIGNSYQVLMNLTFDCIQASVTAAQSVTDEKKRTETEAAKAEKAYQQLMREEEQKKAKQQQQQTKDNKKSRKEDWKCTMD